MRWMHRVARGAICLYVLLCLTGCAGVRPVSDPDIVRITRTEYLPVPAALTAPTPSPEAPAPLCLDGQYAVLCTGQIDDWRVDTAAALDACNADKIAIGSLTPPQPGDVQ